MKVKFINIQGDLEELPILDKLQCEIRFGIPKSEGTADELLISDSNQFAVPAQTIFDLYTILNTRLDKELQNNIIISDLFDTDLIKTATAVECIIYTGSAAVRNTIIITLK